MAAHAGDKADKIGDFSDEKVHADAGRPRATGAAAGW